MPNTHDEVKNPATAPDNNMQAKPNAEKMFSQDEVDKIIRERLKRATGAAAKKAEEEISVELKERVSEIEAKEAEITKKEEELILQDSFLNCKAYVADKDCPADLLDVLDTSNFEDFKAKVDKLVDINWNRQDTIAPLKSTEPIIHDELETAFKHTAREPKHSNY